jgi:hypothetical protein
MSALTVATINLPPASQNGIYTAQLIAQGGFPPYVWTIGGAAGSTTINIQPSGLLTALPTVTGANTFTVTVTDVLGATAAKALSVTVDTAIRFNFVDSIDGYIRLPTGYTSSLYGGTAPRFSAGGGTPPYTFSLATGSLNGLVVGSTGTLSGATTVNPGTFTGTVKVTDSLSHTATARFYLRVLPKDVSVRPAYNTGSGFYVHSDGTFRDPNGFRVFLRGINRDLVNINESAGWANTQAPYVRFTSDQLNATGAEAGADYSTQMNRDHTANKQLVVFTPFNTPSYSPNPSVLLSGDTSVADLSYATQWLCNQITPLTSVVPQTMMCLNVANEWGPHVWNAIGSTNSTWVNAYSGVFANITSVNLTTVTINTVSGTNPFANCPFAWIKGSTPVADQMFVISSTGGSSGAWTITSTTVLGTGGIGGQIGGGAIGALRVAGWLCPIMIDAEAFGDDIGGLLAGAATINNSDPQKNLIFSWHAYNYGTPFQAPITSIVTGATTTLHIASTNTVHPFRNPNVASGFFPEIGVVIQGAAGTGWAALNGTYSVISSNFGGVAGDWTITVAFNSTGLVAGNYTSRSAIAYDWSNPIITAANMAASGLCFVFGEFWAYNPTGTVTPSSLASTDVISACEANGVGYSYWAFDSVSTGGSGGMTSPQGTFTALSNLTVNGLQLHVHPRLSLTALATPAPFFLP